MVANLKDQAESVIVLETLSPARVPADRSNGGHMIDAASGEGHQDHTDRLRSRRMRYQGLIRTCAGGSVP